MSARILQSILYVDDDPDICEVARESFGSIARLDVRVAGCGERAIEAACERRPDLVLLDAMMPGLDGPTTLGLIRGNARIADIPVIFVTAKVLPEEVARFLKLGAIGVIDKPFDPLTIGTQVSALWEKSHGALRNAKAQGDRAHVNTAAGSAVERFLERSRSDVVHLWEIIERLRVTADRSALKEAQWIAHRLHGSGGMFGFPGLSLSGEAIERLLGEAMDGTGATGSCMEPAVLQRLVECTVGVARQLL